MPYFAKFAVIDATSYLLTYVVPDTIYANLITGTPCLLPVKTRTCVGIFLESTPPPLFTCKEIIGTIPNICEFSEPLLKLTRWISLYYLCSSSKSIKLLAPSFFWSTKNLTKKNIFIEKLIASHTNTNNIITKKKAPLKGETQFTEKQNTVLRPEQQHAVDYITQNKPQIILLHGVTGSGKTEVYIESARKVINNNKNVLVLVPEISLTPQMTGRFRNAFGDNLCVFHSMLTKTDYEKEWYRCKLGLAKIVLGVRSAIFAPLTNIGLIIVDEEHDSSYKCDESPCYNARDVAVKRATLEHASCVLGSATPSIESFVNAQQNKYIYVELKERHSNNTPKIEIIDATQHLNIISKTFKKSKTKATKSSSLCFNGSFIAQPIIDLIAQNALNKQQSMIILNRRGFANYSLCTSCGVALKCPHCAVSTTLHKKNAEEHCHYCGFVTKIRTSCPTCGGTSMIAMGAGTQNLESVLAEKIPTLKVARLDRDIMTSNTRLSEIISNFRNGEIDCLIGTQLLSKGHDFPRVTLIAIIHLEDGLFLPDFRASERTFQLLMQSAGRSGRGELPGNVVLQSLILGHPIINFAVQGDLQSFYNREIEIRKISWHPPFSRQILLEFKSKKESDALELAATVKKAIIEHWNKQKFPSVNVRITGPQPAIIEKIKNIFRFQLCITSIKQLLPQQLFPDDLIQNAKLFNKIKVDVDPQNFI